MVCEKCMSDHELNVLDEQIGEVVIGFQLEHISLFTATERLKKLGLSDKEVTEFLDV